MGDGYEFAHKLLELGLIDNLVTIQSVVPYVSAWRFNGGLKVPCRYCCAFHVHGLDGDGGHRVAHCAGDSEYADGGYNLVIVGDFTPEIERKFQDLWCAGD